MKQGALIIFLVNYCAFLFSQDLQMSRNFLFIKKNLPVEIINNHPSYFYVIRQNKVVHDMTIERRAKPSAEIIAFTPLKLDSVNATWFDYENLDYMAFEDNYKLYFVFEKVLNTKRMVYLKIIDTTGKSSGFIELASLESDNMTAEFFFHCMKTINNDILLTATKINLYGIRRKVHVLFSTQKKQIIWTKRLPLENEATVRTLNYTCNKYNDLCYLQVLSSVVGSETFGGITRTIRQMDSLVFWEWESSASAPVPRKLNLLGIDQIVGGFIIPDSSITRISLQGLKEDTLTGDQNEKIVNIGLGNASGNEVFNVLTPYDAKIKEQLTFYDGPQKESSSKQHYYLGDYTQGQYDYIFFERTEGYYYKELLFRKTNNINGEVVLQKIIPRKIFFFKHRTRFKHLEEPMFFTEGERVKVVLAEHPGNFRDSAEGFNYRDFKKETNLSGANIVSYSLEKNGFFNKMLIYRNAEFDLVPLKYSGTEKDMVFYLYNNKFEKFAIWRPYP